MMWIYQARNKENRAKSQQKSDTAFPNSFLMNETALPPAVRPRATKTPRRERMRPKPINAPHYNKDLTGFGYLRGN